MYNPIDCDINWYNPHRGEVCCAFVLSIVIIFCSVKLQLIFIKRAKFHVSLTSCVCISVLEYYLHTKISERMSRPCGRVTCSASVHGVFKGVFIATQLNSTQLNSTRQREQQLTQFVGRDIINKNTTDLAVRCSTGSVEFS